MNAAITPKASYRLPGPASKKDWETMARLESAARTYPSHVHTTFVRAEGVYLFDADDNVYIDCLSGAGVMALGHNHPVVVLAIRAALEAKVPIHMLDLVTPAKTRFVETLLGTFPDAFANRAKVHFCSPSGADAVEAAIKLVKTATGRRSIIAFQGGYHGMTHGALGVTGDVKAKAPVPNLMADVHFFPYPYSYRCPFGLGGDDGANVGIRYLQHSLDDPQSGLASPAAVIVEAVQGEGGNIPAPTWWLAKLRAITAERGIPLILDEVQTGVGRTGMMYAFQHAGIIPDVVLVSKAVGAGLPLAVMLYHESLDSWVSGAHVGTFRANQLAMIAGTALLEFLHANDVVTHARRMGPIERGALDARVLRPPSPARGEATRAMVDCQPASCVRRAHS
ncbi:MAG: aminotransferase class III-fold pyridoxal phosphate-dependent enzyme [bacterium]